MRGTRTAALGSESAAAVVARDFQPDVYGGVESIYVRIGADAAPESCFIVDDIKIRRQ